MPSAANSPRSTRHERIDGWQKHQASPAGSRTYWTRCCGLATFEEHLAELTELVGEEVVRVWRLYLVGGRQAFRDGRMGVDQILSRRPEES